MIAHEEILVRLLKESLEEYMMEGPAAYKCRLPIECSNHPILKAAADYGLIDVAATSSGTPETGLDKYLEIKLSGIRGVKEARLGPELIISNRLPADVWVIFAGKVDTVFGQPPEDIINSFLGLRKDGASIPSEDDQKFLIDDQNFSVAEEYKDVELTGTLSTDEFAEVPAPEHDPNHEYPLPTWASHLSSDLQLGSQLCTKDGRRCGNAVVIGVELKRHESADGTTDWSGKVYTVMTESGNQMRLNADEVAELFHQPEYVMKGEDVILRMESVEVLKVDVF